MRAKLPTRAKKTPSNELLKAGRIAGVFGIRGELKCDPTESGRILFVRGATFQAQGRNVSEPVTIASVREHQKRLLLRFEGIDDATAAARFAPCELLVARDELARGVAPGEYLDIDLIGCRVVDAAGTNLGTVRDVEHYPASDMLVVGRGMIPMIREFILSIDLAATEIRVEIPLGLLNDADATSDGTSSTTN